MESLALSDFVSDIRGVIGRNAYKDVKVNTVSKNVDVGSSHCNGLPSMPPSGRLVDMFSHIVGFGSPEKRKLKTGNGERVPSASSSSSSSSSSNNNNNNSSYHKSNDNDNINDHNNSGTSGGGSGGNILPSSPVHRAMASEGESDSDTEEDHALHGYRVIGEQAGRQLHHRIPKDA
jgi:hypothetical protein